MAFLKNISGSQAPDAELVIQYRNTGSMPVLGELYNRYMDLVYGVCLKYLENPEAARDAVMQVFEELVVKLRKHEVDNFKSWLYTVAKNHCLMQLRQTAGKRTVSLPDTLMQNAEELHLNGKLQQEAEFQKLERCLQTLVPAQQKAVELFYLKQKCYNEIVAETGMEWKQVRSHIQNGRRNLKICMDAQANKD